LKHFWRPNVQPDSRRRPGAWAGLLNRLGVNTHIHDLFSI
jgi:hypothetical protein